ncbi:MAG: hypothetical protein KAT32_00670 [Candidatus Moranbacteria bacterium]|nr:hypothetical protein [Candidatus Moranbacteria bacterium]
MKKNIYIALAILIVGGGYLFLYYREQQSIRLSECRREANNFADKYSNLSLNRIKNERNDCFAVFEINETDNDIGYGLLIYDIFNLKMVAQYRNMDQYRDYEHKDLIWDKDRQKWIPECGLHSNIEEYKDYNFDKYIEFSENEKGEKRCIISDEGKEIVKDTWKELTGEEY